MGVVIASGSLMNLMYDWNMNLPYESILWITDYLIRKEATSIDYYTIQVYLTIASTHPESGLGTSQSSIAYHYTTWILS